MRDFGNIINPHQTKREIAAQQKTAARIVAWMLKSGASEDEIAAFTREREPRRDWNPPRPPVWLEMTCPNCGEKLLARKCKHRCVNCGYFDDCSIGPA